MRRIFQILAAVALACPLRAESSENEMQSYFLSGAAAASGILEGGVIAPAWHAYIRDVPRIDRVQSLILFSSLDRPGAALTTEIFRQESQTDYRHAANLRLQAYGGTLALFGLAGVLATKPVPSWDHPAVPVLGGVSAGMSLRWLVQWNKYSNVMRQLSTNQRTTQIALLAAAPSDRLTLVSYYLRQTEKKTFARTRRLESACASVDFALGAAAFFYAYASTNPAPSTSAFFFAGPDRAGFQIRF